ncbi:GNAT family N-acetyltransferase [Vibrio sp. 10N.261.52.A1]|uniref:GNAT family N-acetyltransferase n=1 Tax=Vibrio TaxID=662 RepID=UPI000C84D0C4|nr:GNAT family N-acetyltransferase [Vibrio sp. 10N.261.52.A1]PML79080.1 GNAT family N-acetyltransferase [Vibrio sp. 10N.261.52.A1]
MEYVVVDATQVPMSLLLEADPSEASIASYLSESWCYAAKRDNKILGVCVVKRISDDTAEIFNVSVSPKHQQQGIGAEVLNFALKQVVNQGIKRVELGTGTFGYQLTYYQRVGFRVDRVVKNHFIDHYPEPIFENGIQHQDMLRLYIEL